MSDLLTGGIRELFGEVFGELYLDGVLHKVVLADDGAGSLTETVTEYPIKGQVDAADEVMRRTEGYTANDCRLIVLQAGVPVEVTTDDRITLGGRLWDVHGPVRRDPAESQWIIHGQQNDAAQPDTGATA